MELYAFFTNETGFMHLVSGYSVFDAMDMIEKAGFSVVEYLGVLVRVTYRDINEAAPVHKYASFDEFSLAVYGELS